MFHQVPSPTSLPIIEECDINLFNEKTNFLFIPRQKMNFH
jgi:hypothetical protein